MHCSSGWCIDLSTSHFCLLETRRISMKQQAQTTKKTTPPKQTAAHKAADKAIEKHQSAQGVTQDERYRLITEMAYLLAEQRGFQGDRAMEDWLQAEIEVDARFAARH
jgi:hypothetical protein